MLPAKTSSPTAFSTGTDSPVIGAWFTLEAPPSTRPSTGIFSPGRTSTTSPTRTSSAGTVSSAPARLIRASLGASAISARMAPRARSMV